MHASPLENLIVIRRNDVISLCRFQLAWVGLRVEKTCTVQKYTEYTYQIISYLSAYKEGIFDMHVNLLVKKSEEEGQRQTNVSTL